MQIFPQTIFYLKKSFKNRLNKFEDDNFFFYLKMKFKKMRNIMEAVKKKNNNIRAFCAH